MINAKHIMKFHASQDIPLTYKEAYDLGVYALKGCKGDELAKIQSIAILSSLHDRNLYAWSRKGVDNESFYLGHKIPINAAEQIAGICAAIFQNDIAVSENGFLNPNVPFVMDNCGMGGDIIVTANVSTLAAFIAAAGGIPMCKHGSPANADQGKYGSSDFILLICGIDTYASKTEVEKCVEKTNFGYTEALDTKYKLIHLQTHKFAMLPHMNDIVGPITNPVNPQKITRRVLGVNHLINPKIVAEAYKIMNQRGITNLEHGIFVRGFADDKRYAGMDEVSICSGGTRVAELKNGEIREYDLYAKDFGLQPVMPEEISPVGNKGEFSMKILRGEITGAPLRMVLANAAILFYLAGESNNFRECFNIAKDVFKSGKAYETMIEVKNMLPRKSDCN